MSYEKLRERQTASELRFDGKILHLYRDDIELPNGQPAEREVIRHVGAVCVIPVTDDGRAVMERQYRYPVDEVILEIPAGKQAVLTVRLLPHGAKKSKKEPALWSRMK